MESMRSTRPFVLLVTGLFPVLLLLLFLSAGVHARTLVGGWSPIKDLNDPYIREIAEFAVTEHNKQNPGFRKLLLKTVVSGQEQVVEGFNYSLFLEVKYANGVPAGRYEALVWDNPRFRELASFKPTKA